VLYTDTGDILGAYTETEISSNQETLYDPNAFIFKLDSNLGDKKYTSTNGTDAVFNNPKKFI